MAILGWVEDVACIVRGGLEGGGEVLPLKPVSHRSQAA